ncbi:hypothetical protein FrEUN1fDRAFT_0385 [Parafrankia sp. EUN1f]|nr:hypothetical protein FrEUN1fDRAFT_0385 [Parafrankia sp. EUN1f]
MITLDSPEYLDARTWSSATEENLLRRLNYTPPVEADEWTAYYGPKAAALGVVFARANPGVVSADDVAQTVMAYLWEHRDRIDWDDTNLINVIMRRAAERYCSGERRQRLMRTDRWVYLPDHVRALLPVFFEDVTRWSDAPIPEGGESVIPGNGQGEALAGVLDIARVWPRLSDSNRRALVARHLEGGEFGDKAAQRRHQRAVDALTELLNRSQI